MSRRTDTPISGKLVDGVFRRVLAADVTPELRNELAQSGLDLGALAEGYPREVWYRAVSVTAATLFPQEPPEEQLRCLGRHVIASLVSRGIIRGPWLAMARLMGPRRALRQAAGHLEESPVALSVTERGRSEFEIVVEEEEQPEFLVGLLEAACTALGARDCRVTVEGRSQGWTILRASWR